MPVFDLTLAVCHGPGHIRHKRMRSYYTDSLPSALKMMLRNAKHDEGLEPRTHSLSAVLHIPDSEAVVILPIYPESDLVDEPRTEDR